MLYFLPCLRVLGICWIVDEGQDATDTRWWPAPEQGMQRINREAAADSLGNCFPQRYASDDLLPQLPDDFPTFLADEPEISSQQHALDPSHVGLWAGFTCPAPSGSTSASFSADDMDCSYPLPAGTSPPALSAGARVPTVGFSSSAAAQLLPSPGNAIKPAHRNVPTVIGVRLGAAVPNGRHAAPTPAIPSNVTAEAAGAMSTGGKSRPSLNPARVLRQPVRQQQPTVRLAFLPAPYASTAVSPVHTLPVLRCPILRLIHICSRISWRPYIVWLVDVHSQM